MNNTTKWTLTFAAVYLAAFIYNLHTDPVSLTKFQEIQVPSWNIFHENNRSQIVFRHDSIDSKPLVL